MTHKRQLILASKSPRRKQLLDQLGLQVVVLDVDIDEATLDIESPLEYVARLAKQKALAALKLLAKRDVKTAIESLANAGPALILAADTCIVFEQQIIGKPRDANHAGNILRQLSNNEHQVLSAICLLEVESNYTFQSYNRVNTTHVEFKILSDKEIYDYWQTGEPVDKAAGYAIQGLGATFIKNIRGSYSAVMGLPLFETAELLAHIGMPILEQGDAHSSIQQQ